MTMTVRHASIVPISDKENENNTVHKTNKFTVNKKITYKKVNKIYFNYF